LRVFTCGKRGAYATYITQGRYTREAIKGVIVRPEDRAAEVARLLGKGGGRLIGPAFKSAGGA
jgi:hypothetical protein